MDTRTLIGTVARDLALDRGPGTLRDRASWVLAAAGLVPGVTLWAGLGVDPGPSVLRGAVPWVGAIVLQPLIEEILFRGLLQGALLHTRFGRRAWIRLPSGGLSYANLGASALFVTAHFVHHAPLWALATLAPSLALGWLRERHRSTWAAAAMHAVFNLEFFATAALFVR